MAAAWGLSKAAHKVEQREESDRCRVCGLWPSPLRVASLESHTPGAQAEVGKEARQGRRNSPRCGAPWGKGPVSPEGPHVHL